MSSYQLEKNIKKGAKDAGKMFNKSQLVFFAHSSLDLALSTT